MRGHLRPLGEIADELDPDLVEAFLPSLVALDRPDQPQVGVLAGVGVSTAGARAAGQAVRARRLAQQRSRS